MHPKIRCLFVALVGGCSLVCASRSALAAEAADGGGSSLSSGAESAPWSRWQARVSFAADAPSWRGGFGASSRDAFGDGAGDRFRASDAAGPGRRTAGLESFSLLGDYYFARPFSPAGGLRATSGLIVGPRSQGLSIAQPGLMAGGSFSVDSRGFGAPALLRSGRETASSNDALPYIGLGYTGRAAHGALSLSADVGMLGAGFGDASARPFGPGLRSLDEPGRDTARLLPVLQLGVLYSF